MSNPPNFTLINDCPLAGGGGGGQIQQLSDKLRDLLMKHPREKQTYTKQDKNDFFKSSKRLWL